MKATLLLATLATAATTGVCFGDTARFDIINLPLAGSSLIEVDHLGPGGRAVITNTRFVLNYDTLGEEYFADDIVVGLQAPVVEPVLPPTHPSGLPTELFSGAGIGWFGHGAFTADFTTDAFNGVTVDGDFGLYLVILTFSSPATVMGGQFTNSYIEVEYTPGPGPLPCPADLTGDRVIDVFDLLAYLDLWFAGELAADLDMSEAVDVFDLLAYLDLWFAAECP